MDLSTSAYRIVQTATGDINPKSPSKMKAGKIGGTARAKALSKRKRKQIALKANRARWKLEGEK
jgi:hypothetical protein